MGANQIPEVIRSRFVAYVGLVALVDACTWKWSIVLTFAGQTQQYILFSNSSRFFLRLHCRIESIYGFCLYLSWRTVAESIMKGLINLEECLRTSWWHPIAVMACLHVTRQIDESCLSSLAIICRANWALRHLLFDVWWVGGNVRTKDPGLIRSNGKTPQNWVMTIDDLSLYTTYSLFHHHCSSRRHSQLNPHNLTPQPWHRQRIHQPTTDDGIALSDSSTLSCVHKYLFFVDAWDKGRACGWKVSFSSCSKVKWS